MEHQSEEDAAKWEAKLDAPITTAPRVRQKMNDEDELAQLDQFEQ